MTRRRVFVLIHRWNGLLLAGFLTIVGLTGAALAWKVPLERVFAPQFFVLKHHAPQRQRANPLFVRQGVEQAFPWAYVDVADLSAVADAPLQFSLTPRSSQRDASVEYDAFADPFSGEVLGSRRYADLRQGAINIVPCIFQLHQELALGSFGTTCLGIAALLWTIDSFIGMYLSFPASQRDAGVPLMARLRGWPGRFWPSFKIRWQAGGFRRLYDLHRAPGVWLWLLLLIFSWSGVAFNLPAVYGSVMKIFGGAISSPIQKTGACPVSDGNEVWVSHLALARRLMRAQSDSRRFQILAERFLSYDRGACRWTYRVRSTLDVDSIGNTQLIWADGLESAAKFGAPTGGSRADTFTTWIEAIHEAQVGGTAVQLLVCCGGLTTVLLCLTGVMVFIRKICG